MDAPLVLSINAADSDGYKHLVCQSCELLFNALI